MPRNTSSGVFSLVIKVLHSTVLDFVSVWNMQVRIDRVSVITCSLNRLQWNLFAIPSVNLVRIRVTNKNTLTRTDGKKVTTSVG